MLGLDPFVEHTFEKIKDAQQAPVLQEQLSLLRSHIAFIMDKLATAEKNLAKAEAELEAKTKDVETMRSQLAAFDGKAKLVEIGPCFVKVTAQGKRLPGVYCPACHMPMHKGEYRVAGIYHYACMKCDIKLPCELVDGPLADWTDPVQDPN